MQSTIEHGRHTYLGASEVAVALGYSTWKTAYELWQFKTGKDGGPDQTGPMKRGNDMEARILSKLLEKYPGATISHEQQEFVHPDMPWLRAHVDGILTMEDGTRHIVEAKAPGDNMLRVHRENGLPRDYICQMLTCIELAMLTEGFGDIKSGIYGVLDYEGWDVEAFRVEGDRDTFAGMAGVLKEFWYHVETGTPYEFIQPPEIPVTSGARKDVDGIRAEELAYVLIQAKADKKAAEGRYKEAVADIVELVGEPETLVHLHGMVRMSRPLVTPKPKPDAARLLRWARDVANSYAAEDKANLDILLLSFDEADFTTQGNPYRRPVFSGVGDYKGMV